MPQIDLYYSQSLLGHFTLIIHDKVDLIVHRIHFVDRDAAASHSGILARIQHKFVQVTGCATGEVLSDWKSSPHEFRDRVNYGNLPARRCIQTWHIGVSQMDNMLAWVHRTVQNQQAGQFTRYGYIIYADHVGNCGSFAVKCLEQAGIRISMHYLKTWLQLPTLIQSDF